MEKKLPHHHFLTLNHTAVTTHVYVERERHRLLHVRVETMGMRKPEATLRISKQQTGIKQTMEAMSPSNATWLVARLFMSSHQ
jgi:hypothetical protein